MQAILNADPAKRYATGLQRISFDKYSHIPRVNSGILKLLKRSPAHYRHRLDSELELTLPKWATNYDSDEDLSGLDLDFGSDAVLG